MSQLIKLGLMSPETPHNLLSIAQQMWANNGDIISRQYAGTNALKVRITLSKRRKIFFHCHFFFHFFFYRLRGKNDTKLYYFRSFIFKGKKSIALPKNFQVEEVIDFVKKFTLKLN